MFIYSFIYDNYESDLCKLESESIFNKVEHKKGILSEIQVEPSSSAFIKNRLEIISSSNAYSTLIKKIKNNKIRAEGFKVEYHVFDGDKTEYNERLNKLRDVGYSIEGNPDYYSPTIIYGLCHYEQVWHFGILTKNNFEWQKHKQKPCTYSNSISMSIAKALVNIASKANKDCELLDACCGVGTIMLEACFAGYRIEGCDIKEKICEDARKNLSYFNYSANVYHTDIKNMSKIYGAALIDLPYNLFSSASDDDLHQIIHSSAKISNRLIIVSTLDISEMIKMAGLKLSNYCVTGKRGKRDFVRRVWVCEKVD